MTTDPVDYSIIIPAYNETAELPATLAAIERAMAAQTESGQCIVVDNNSADDTAAVARRFDKVTVVFEPINQIARARNTGAKASQGRHLIFVDADTRIDPSLLEETLRRLRSGECAGGGSVIQFEGTIPAVGRWSIAIWTRISQLFRIAAGSYVYCRRDAFEAIGGFDEKLYASEEVRFSRKIKRWGKARQLSFDILSHAPVHTSARKLEWYSGPQIVGWVALMMVMPIAVRYRKLCGFWYKRPAKS
jgi:glycosyltransferase involved in cell wall biosynthesis